MKLTQKQIEFISIALNYYIEEVQNGIINKDEALTLLQFQNFYNNNYFEAYYDNKLEKNIIENFYNK